MTRHFSISNVCFAFWAFFRKLEKLGSHTGSKWWPGRKRWPTDQETQWPSSMSAAVLLKFACIPLCIYLSYTTQHGAVLIIFPLYLQTAHSRWTEQTCSTRLSVLTEHPLVADTKRQTHGHGQYRASIVSCGNNIQLAMRAYNSPPTPP